MKKVNIKIENNKGITLVTLAITIIVLLIMAGITIKIGTKGMDEARVQNVKTNMLLIEAKTKEYVEDANFELGVNKDRIEQAKIKLEENVKGTKVLATDEIYTELINIGITKEDINAGKVYKLETQNLIDMGIKGVDSNKKDGYYIVIYNIEKSSAEIYLTTGIKLENNELAYSLNEIRDI